MLRELQALLAAIDAVQPGRDCSVILSRWGDLVDWLTAARQWLTVYHRRSTGVSNESVLELTGRILDAIDQVKAEEAESGRVLGLPALLWVSRSRMGELGYLMRVDLELYTVAIRERAAV